MIGVLQGAIECLPLLGQAFLDTRAQALEQFLVLGCADKPWERIQDQQQVRQLRALRHLAISLGLQTQASISRVVITVLMQIRRQHLSVA